ncbi:MAG: hypothetical protein WA885_24940 [Phormidesmis sp.]
MIVDMQQVLVVVDWMIVDWQIVKAAIEGVFVALGEVLGAIALPFPQNHRIFSTIDHPIVEKQKTFIQTAYMFAYTKFSSNLKRYWQGLACWNTILKMRSDTLLSESQIEGGC